jgi:hypothetical protein
MQKDRITIFIPHEMGGEARATAIRGIAEQIAKGKMFGKFGDAEWAYDIGVGIQYMQAGPGVRMRAEDVVQECERIRKAYNIPAVFIAATETIESPFIVHIASSGFRGPDDSREMLRQYLEKSAWRGTGSEKGTEG